MPQPVPEERPQSNSSPMPSNVVTVEFPAEFWSAVQALAQQAGVTPETVLSAGTSLFSLALKAKADNHKMAIIEADQPCVTEIKGI